MSSWRVLKQYTKITIKPDVKNFSFLQTFSRTKCLTTTVLLV